jgi:hypothetical protein
VLEVLAIARGNYFFAARQKDKFLLRRLKLAINVPLAMDGRGGDDGRASLGEAVALLHRAAGC